MANFLAVPLKKTSEIDLVKPLKYVFSGFCVSADEPVNYDDALVELNKLRMNSTWRTLDKHESSLDVMTRYYDQLNFLDSKCSGVDFQVPFKWKDAFDEGGFFRGSASLTLSVLIYEKVCILFNIAAMQSQVACSHITDSRKDEGLKQAARYFQLSSGTFQYLKQVSSTPAIKDPTPDLQQDVLTSLHVLMLAQAQESFFFKATADNMKDTIIAKVACRTEELYADATKCMSKDTVQHIWDKEWLSIVSCKKSIFQSLAEYYQSLVCKAKKDFGEELARLQLALEAMKSAESKRILPSDFKDYLAKINHGYEEAKKDNDFIYHAKIPNAKSLMPIGKAELAKPIIPTEKMNPNSEDLFGLLLPMAVQQALSAFEIRKMEIVNGEKAKLQSETQMLNGILASLNLPAALEDTTGNTLPQSLREKAQAVAEKGGMQALQHLLEELPSLLQRNNEILKECDGILKDEEDSDNKLREKFGAQWIRTPSAKLNDPLKANLRKFKELLNNAVSADGIVKEKFSSNKDAISLLSKSEAEILSQIPAGNPVAHCPSVEQLKKLMMDVERLKSEREMLLGELDSATMDMREKFLSALSNEGGINEAALSVEKLGEIYGPIQKQIRENIAKQEQLLSSIQQVNNEFSKEKDSSGSAAQRELILSSLASAHDAYMELSQNLEEGCEFYNNLTQVLVNFQNKINDFCFARRTEKDELCRDVQKVIVSEANQAPAPSPPQHHQPGEKPARPPPPNMPTAPAPQPWGYPPPMPQHQPQATVLAQAAPLPYPAYPYPYPPTVNPYQYPQMVMPPFPPAQGYQGQMYGTYPPPRAPTYPTQQYRPWQK